MIEAVEHAANVTGIFIGGGAVGAVTGAAAFYLKKHLPEVERLNNLVNHHKGLFEGKEKELDDLLEKQKKDAEKPYFLNRTCGFRKKDHFGHYTCEALNGIHLTTEYIQMIFRGYFFDRCDMR